MNISGMNGDDDPFFDITVFDPRTMMSSSDSFKVLVLVLVLRKVEVRGTCTGNDLVAHVLCTGIASSYR